VPSNIDAVLATLPARHGRALRWFLEHAGQEVSWPQPLSDGTLLATKAKGIYKPGWSPYALSVRQSLAGPYPDRDVEREEDGAWRYMYFQEGFLPADRDEFFTNRGLIECWRDAVPVGVIIQTGSSRLSVERAPELTA
jgi:hypothetical protein